MAGEAKNKSGMPDMALAILEKLTGMNAEFSFDFDNMSVELPGKASTPDTQIRINGTLRIRTRTSKNQ